MKYTAKAITTIPAWAEAMADGTFGKPDTINSTTAAYAYVPLIFRATRLVCNALVGAPIRFYKGRNEVEWPFPDVSLKRLLWYSQASMSLMGANYIEKIPRALSKKTGSLKWVNPTTMRPPVRTVDKDGNIAWEFTQNNQTQNKWTLDTMIYMREFSLRDDIGPGDSSGGVALNDAALLRYMSRFAARFFEAGAMPITVLQIDGMVDKDEAVRIEGFFKKAATRIRNAFNVLALSRAIEPKVISQPLKDLVMPELADQARRAVADAFDFHPSLLDEAPNMATAQEHRKSLYEDSVKPRAELMEEEFNRQLLSEMGLEMRFAFEEMDIFQDDEEHRAASVEVLTRAISQDPEVAEFVMNTVLGYDLDEMQQQKFDELIEKKKTKPPAPALVDTTPAPVTESQTETVAQPAKAVWADDMIRWERKALRVLKESGSAVCNYISDNIPPKMREEIEYSLPACKTPEQVRSLFDNQPVTQTPVQEYKSDDVLILANSLNTLAEAYTKARADDTQTLFLEAIKAMQGNTKKEDDMQIIINSPANVDVTSRDTVEAVKAMNDSFGQLKDVLAAMPSPNITINTPEQPPAQVTVQVEPTPVEFKPQNNIVVQPAENNITVQPSDVVVDIPRVKREKQKVKRGKDKLITNTETEFEYEDDK